VAAPDILIGRGHNMIQAQRPKSNLSTQKPSFMFKKFRLEGAMAPLGPPLAPLWPPSGGATEYYKYNQYDDGGREYHFEIPIPKYYNCKIAEGGEMK
jgi:hypothetical protein